MAQTVRGFLWLAVLGPILGVSAFSMFYVARYLGAPPWIAICASTCFDGVALLCADYSLRYAQAGLSGSAPRTVVRIFALLGAYVQTLHARIGGGPPGSWVFWASLPIGAVTVYEVHIRFERRKALARSGVHYPAPLPAFGLVTWALFPINTLKSLREIVGKRKEAIVMAARGRPTIAETSNEEPKRTLSVVGGRTNAKPKAGVNAHSPKRAHRQWLRAHGHPVKDRARIPAHLLRIAEEGMAREAGEQEEDAQ
jgi:hypothetical protein